MKKKIVCLLLSVMLLVPGSLTAYAAEDTGAGDHVSDDWKVSFTEAGRVEDNLGSGSSANDRIGTMQPGDEITVSVALANENSETTYWYMKNTITKSMEEAQATGGAYSYNLVYVDPSGNPVTLYSSESVGGDDSAGLKAVDSRIGEEYFYLGSIAGGQRGTVRLTVGLDGETQGNSYMDKVANLTMNFAVEPQPGTTGGGSGGRNTRTVRREVVNNQIVFIDDEGVPLSRNTNIVRTSDEMNLFPDVLTACVSGSLLLMFAVFALVGRKKEEEEGAVE